jgi:nucleoside-diphosphate-sugar epimerase
VHTSPIDVFHAERGSAFDESQVAGYPKGTAYERSKQRAEELVLAERRGMEVVILNPVGVYGPGVARTENFEKGLFEPIVEKKVPALPPGGASMVYIDGVVQGHLSAGKVGKDGERYILSDGYISMKDLAELVVRLAGRGRVPPTMPVPLAKAFAATGSALSRLIKRPPMLSRGQLHYLLWQANADSSKAQRELGFTPTPIEDGVRRTLEHMGLAG